MSCAIGLLHGEHSFTSSARFKMDENILMLVQAVERLAEKCVWLHLRMKLPREPESCL